MAPTTASSSRSGTTAAFAGFAAGSAITLFGVWIASKQFLQSSPANKTMRANGSNAKKTTEIPAEIREEQLSRHTLYFGDEGMSKLKGASIVVVGVGGVGSHVAHMLGRAGVGHIRLIDFDQVTVSSLNRHACAILADVGIPKVTCMKDFMEKICPDRNHLLVESIAEMYTQENGERLLKKENNDDKPWDIVIDAIDDVPTKAALLAHCLKENIRVMSCMGAGGKSDVTRLHISDLRTAVKDPLASKLRQYLKKLIPVNNSGSSNGCPNNDYLENMEKLSIIYSSEKTVAKLADFTPEQKEQGVHNFGAVDGMRIRVLPVLGTMPAVMGQTLAAMALCELGGKPMSPVIGERVGKNVRNRMYQHLKRREDGISKAVLANTKDAKMKSLDIRNLPIEGVVVDGTWIGPVQVDQDDVAYMMNLWRNRCAATGDRLGNVLELVRWDNSKPAQCNNLVLLGTAALKKFDEDGLEKESIPKEVQCKIEQRLASCNIDEF